MPVGDPSEPSQGTTEDIPASTAPSTQPVQDSDPSPKGNEDASYIIIWIAAGVVVLAFVGFVIYRKRKQ